MFTLESDNHSIIMEYKPAAANVQQKPIMFELIKYLSCLESISCE